MPLYPDPINRLQLKIDEMQDRITSAEAELAQARTKLAQYVTAKQVLVDNDV